MPLTATQALQRAQVTYPEITSALGLAYLNDEWAELAARYNLMDDELWVALTAEDQEFTIAESLARMKEVRLYTGADTSQKLTLTYETEKDLYESGWRTRQSGTPTEYLFGSETSSNTGVRTISLIPKPDTTSLSVTDATNATPIVITTGTHGLSDGAQVRCVNVGGNTAANVLAYAKVTGYSTTTFAMYSDEALTLPIAGNGAYTSGGSVVCANSPAIRLYYTRSSTLVGADNLPNIGPNSDIFVTSICKRYADARLDRNEYEKQADRYNRAVSRFEEYLGLQAENHGAIIKPYHMQPRRVF